MGSPRCPELRNVEEFFADLLIPPCTPLPTDSLATPLPQPLPVYNKQLQSGDLGQAGRSGGDRINIPPQRTLGPPLFFLPSLLMCSCRWLVVH